MSRYNKLIKEILDGILEGYTLDKGKLKVVNETATKNADAALHKLVLEKSRDLWDDLEAAEDSLTGVAEEISFEELNTDPSSVDMTLSSGSNEPAQTKPQLDAEPTLENLLGSSDFDLGSVFENMDHLEPAMADGGRRDEPTMMDSLGDDEDVVDGDEDYEDLEIGMDDADMGSTDMEGEEGEEGEFGDEEGLGGEFGDEEGLDLEPEGDMEGGIKGDATFDFDLDLGDEEGLGGEFGDEEGLGDENGLGGEFGDEEGLGGEFGDEEGLGDENGLEDKFGDEEEEVADEGYGGKPYRMETKGRKGKKGKK